MRFVVKKGGLFLPSKEMKKIAWVNNKKIYTQAEKDPVKFWEEQAKKITWFKPWENVYLEEPPYFKWFVGGKLNISYNCLDRHLKDKKDKVALIWEPELIEERPRTFTYHELYKQVNKLANALKKLGVKKGDIIGIYLPMIPETLISMLACARIGAVHTVVFSAFSPEALRTRLQISEAKVLITADGYYRRGKLINLKENADEGIKETGVEKVVVVKRAGNKVSWNPEKNIWFEDLVRNESDGCKPEEMNSEDLLFVLFTSGTTGIPKGICHTTGGYTVQAYLTGKWIFDFHEKDILWCTSDFGWITGHSYTCYSPLLNGITTLIFEGAPDYPTPDRWVQIIEKHKVTIFYTAPTAVRMFEKMNGNIAKKYDFKTLRLLGSVGEPFDEGSWNWYFKNVGKERCPIVDTWWQTETGGILISSLPGVGPFKPAFVGLPFPGVKVEILDDKGRKCKKGKTGNLVILSPFPPSLLRGIYKDEKKYLETYWGKYGNKIYFTSDGAFRDENGLIRIVGRVDDVIKVAGHRISTGEIENALDSHLAVVESAVVGIPDEIKGEVPFAFVVLKQGFEVSENLKEELMKQVDKKIGPIAKPAKIIFVEDLPKTRSGKIVRRILRNILRNEVLGDLSTVSNPECIEKIKKEIKL